MSKDNLLAQRAVEMEDVRPKILVSGRHMRDITAECLHLMLSANQPNPRFFRLGDVLVEVPEGFDGIGSRHFTNTSLKGTLDRLANFVKIDKDDEKPARPPNDVVADILSLANPPLPVLQGVIQAVTSRQVV